MSAPGPLASGLYPIVRRFRRPMVVVESVPDRPPAGAPEPPPPKPAVASVSYSEPIDSKRNDEDASTEQPAK
jgi:hypothetical protein